MNLNFTLREMTHLRYFAPIVIESAKQGIKSTFYIGQSNKYNCPLLPVNSRDLLVFAKQNGVELKSMADLKTAKDVIITNEKSCMEQISELSGVTKVATTYQTDFVYNYKTFNYEDVYDYIAMPSRNIAKFYEIESDKNIYVGISKYDVSIQKNEVVKKYGLSEDRNIVIFIWPKARDMHKMPIDIISNFNELGWQVVVKTRGKDPINRNTVDYLTSNGNVVLSDSSWYPHTTQELLESADLVVNSGSTMIEECIMHNTPLINFDIKPKNRHGRVHKHRVTHSYLYEYDFCLNLKGLDASFTTDKLDSMVKSLLEKDMKKSFESCKRDWLYTHDNSSRKLIQHLKEVV